MRRLLTALLITAFFSFLQASLFTRLSWLTFGLTPDLALIFLALFSISFGRTNGMVTGFMSGLIQDFLSFSPLGYYALIKMLLGSLFGALKDKVMIETLPIVLIIISIATFAKYLFALVISTFIAVDYHHLLLSRTFLLELIINNLVAIPAYFFFKFIIKKLAHLWQYEGERR
ncbi:MAG: rod shape-determining protein MreD [Spirochaetaceae bacterium]|nr:rod shape-determining protein MreD [Spirochaetaceae bacterium]